MAKDKDSFHDNYGILTPRGIYFIKCPFLTERAAYKRQGFNFLTNSITFDNYGKREALNLIYSTQGMVTMKMLAVYEDGKEHHYNEVCEKLGLAQGNDIDCWRSLVDRDLIGFSSKHDYGKKFYTITPLGEEVLAIAAANNAYYRIARWFKLKGEDVYSAMMKADLNGEESWKDLLPESMTAFLEQVFNPTSRLRQIGSAYRWMNNFMYLLKTNDDFYEKATDPEVMSWIDSHKDQYSDIENYIKKLNRMQKKKMKKVN